MSESAHHAGGAAHLGRGRAGWAQRGWVTQPPLVVGALLFLVGVALPSRKPAPSPLHILRGSVGELRQQVDALSQETTLLEARLQNPDPREVYLVVDTQANRLSLYQGRHRLRDAVVSTGSGKTLLSPDGSRHWIFATPRGVRHVQAKVEDPVWYKPDWAFVEDGLPVPPLSDRTRVAKGVLGAYALDLGDQIKIHGTREKDKLGTPVSHGCIRVGDEDLEVLYRTVPIGARVFFY